MKGLKNVRTRRTDTLTQVGWEQLESLLAVYYRGQGYTVDHCGTGASGARFDGGIDLKLRKDDAYVLVQCKHWNAKQVPHNDVHQLLGLMVNEGATGAVLVTSGEFTRAAIEAATKQGHVQLVDGDDLRAMLGPLPENRRGHERGGSIATAVNTGLWLLVLKLLFGLVIVLILTGGLRSVIASLSRASSTPAEQTAGQKALPVPNYAPLGGVMQDIGAVPSRQAEVIDHYTGTTIEDRPGGMPAYRPLSTQEVRGSQRRADEAARVIEASTPEM